MPSGHGHSRKRCLLLQHGWGFDAACWHEWRQRHDTVCAVNRGYWGEPRSFEALDVSLADCVLVCHSLGLHLLSPGVVAQAGALVIISGFAHFHGQSREDGRFSRKHLQKMLARLEDDPLALLHDFYRDCDCADWPLPADKLNTALLTSDLLLLDQGRIDSSSFSSLPPTLMLHGSRDRIVRPARAEELAGVLGNVQASMIDGAGHGLPFTHPEICLDRIEQFLTDNL